MRLMLKAYSASVIGWGLRTPQHNYRNGWTRINWGRKGSEYRHPDLRIPYRFENTPTSRWRKM